MVEVVTPLAERARQISRLVVIKVVCQLVVGGARRRLRRGAVGHDEGEQVVGEKQDGLGME